MPEYNAQKTAVFADLRGNVGLNQQAAAEFFGMKNRGSISDWELGKTCPHPTRRKLFIVYMLDKLRLRSEPQKFIDVWADVVVGQWGWRPLSDDEISQSFPGGDVKSETSRIIVLTGSALMQHTLSQATIPNLVDMGPSGVVQNGDFEDGQYDPNRPPLYWTPDSWQWVSSLIWDNTQAHSGSKSVCINSPIANDARWIQTVKVEPNTDYKLSGWIKTKNVAHASEVVDAGANLSLFGTWTRSVGLLGTNDWTYVTLPFNSGHHTLVIVAARLGYWAGTTTGIAWFDDISLERLTQNK